MATEVRQDADMAGALLRCGTVLLSFVAGWPLVWGLIALSEGNPVVIPAAILAGFLPPIAVLVVLCRRAYRCGKCGGQCKTLADDGNKWRYHCAPCDIEWQIDRSNE